MRKLFFIFCSLLLVFASCKKKSEERISPFVGKWKYTGYSYQAGGPAKWYSVKADPSFILEIKSNSTFVSYDTLGNEIFKGDIKFKKKDNQLYITNKFKSGEFTLIESLTTIDRKIYFYPPLNRNGNVPKNNLFFNGEYVLYDRNIYFKKL